MFATRAKRLHAHFDGEADHAGEHITYRRAGAVLTFTGDFLHAGKPFQVVINFDRAVAEQP
jgi:Ca2+-binding RTX toxin-like protein